MEDSFWDIVTQGRWVAHVKRQEGIFYSPWMLRGEDATKRRYVHPKNHPYLLD